MNPELFWIAVCATSAGSGLMAGVFFAFSVAVMPALARRPAAEAIRAMQTINRVILNPWFLSVYLATGFLSAALVALSLSGIGWHTAGALMYLAGCMGVTGIFNLPLNNRLAAADADSAEGAQTWALYVRTWTRWNHVRSVACLAAMVLFYLAISPHSRS